MVTADLLFSAPSQRARYRAVPAETVEGQRAYGFMLAPQPDMQEDRHFHIVSVVVLVAGSDAGSPMAIAGPNGGFSEHVVQTSDGRYELRISEGVLLPDNVQLAPFDAVRVGQALISRYQAVANDRP